MNTLLEDIQTVKKEFGSDLEDWKNLIFLPKKDYSVVRNNVKSILDDIAQDFNNQYPPESRSVISGYDHEYVASDALKDYIKSVYLSINEMDFKTPYIFGESTDALFTLMSDHLENLGITKNHEANSLHPVLLMPIVANANRNGLALSALGEQTDAPKNVGTFFIEVHLGQLKCNFSSGNYLMKDNTLKAQKSLLRAASFDNYYYLPGYTSSDGSRHRGASSGASPKHGAGTTWRPDWFKEHCKTLGVPADASLKDIRTAYRQLALQWHPDKHSSKTPDEQKVAGEEFKKINAAFQALCDSNYFS